MNQLHKETIDVSVADGERNGEVRHYGLKAFLLQQGRRYSGREGWTLPYRGG